MKITLIEPKMTLRPMDSEFKRRMAPSLALLTLGALTPEEHDVTIRDENVRPIAFDEPADLVGITVNVDASTRAYTIADRFRALGRPVAMGGIHASANPEEALRHADAVCVGEAEGVWPKMIEDAARGRLRGRYRRETPADPAEIPTPRWELLDPGSYLVTNVVCATRGCPFKCDFCYNSCDYVRGGYRPRPVANVMRDIARLGTPHVLFIDDNLIGNLSWAWDLVRTMAPLGLTWHAAVSANVGEHPDLMDAMRASGCKSLFIGFESINEASLRSAGKKQNRAERYEALVAALHERGIMVNASLAFGFDDDGPDVFARTLEWLVRNKLESMTAHILTPYPGTRLFARLDAEGRIDDKDWSHYNTAHVVFRPRRMTKEQLREGYLRMYERFYSLGSVLERLPAHRPNRIPYLLFNVLYRKFGRPLSRLATLGFMRTAGNIGRRLSYGVG